MTYKQLLALTKQYLGTKRVASANIGITQPPLPAVAVTNAMYRLNNSFASMTSFTADTINYEATGNALQATPTRSGNVILIMRFTGGTQSNANGSSAGITGQLFFGTGTPPARGAAVGGTAIGNNFTSGWTGAPALSVLAGQTTYATLISIQRKVGLTLNTTYWFDIGLRVAVTSDTVNGQTEYMAFEDGV